MPGYTLGDSLGSHTLTLEIEFIRCCFLRMSELVGYGTSGEVTLNGRPASLFCVPDVNYNGMIGYYYKKNPAGVTKKVRGSFLLSNFPRRTAGLSTVSWVLNRSSKNASMIYAFSAACTTDIALCTCRTRTPTAHSGQVSGVSWRTSG